jgi:hypothetical protein
MDSYWVQRYEIWDQSPVDTSQTDRTSKAALPSVFLTQRNIYIYTCIQYLHQLMYRLFCKYKCIRVNAAASARIQIPLQGNGIYLHSTHPSSTHKDAEKVQYNAVQIWNAPFIKPFITILLEN